MEKKTVLLLSGLAACFCVAAAKALNQDSREANLQDMILRYGRIKPQYEGMVFSVTSKAFQNWYADTYGFSLGELVAALFYTSSEHKKLIDKDPTRTWTLLKTMAVEWNGNYPDLETGFLVYNAADALYRSWADYRSGYQKYLRALRVMYYNEHRIQIEGSLISRNSTLFIWDYNRKQDLRNMEVDINKPSLSQIKDFVRKQVEQNIRWIWPTLQKEAQRCQKENPQWVDSVYEKIDEIGSKLFVSL